MATILVVSVTLKCAPCNFCVCHWIFIFVNVNNYRGHCYWGSGTVLTCSASALVSPNRNCFSNGPATQCVCRGFWNVLHLFIEQSWFGFRFDEPSGLEEAFWSRSKASFGKISEGNSVCTCLHVYCNKTPSLNVFPFDGVQAFFILIGCISTFAVFYLVVDVHV